MKQKIYIFLFEGFSDWEISFLTPEINKNEDFELVYFSENRNQINSMGGLQITPNISLNEIDIEEIDMLILPGGTAWENGNNHIIKDLVKALSNQGKPIAAICAATTFLGELGLLNSIKHTSNDLNYLKAIAPNYTGDENYEYSSAVTDNNIITANGISPIEFSREIFKTIKLYNEDGIEKWFQLFKNGIWSE